MKKILITAFILFGFLGYSQTKKKVYKKPVKKTYVKKKPAVTPKAEAKPYEVVQEANPQTQAVVPTAEPKNVEQLPQANAKPEYEITAEKILKKNGWIKNRNSALVRGIEGFVKGVYVGNDKIFVLLEIANRTNINYDIESISFITSPIQNGNRQLEAEEKIFFPVYSNQPENLQKKKVMKLVYVFDKFTIADNKNLLFIMNEIEGERTLTLEIKPKYIVGAEFIK